MDIEIRPTDTQLAGRLASREWEALGALYDRHAGSVYGYARLVTRRAKDARRVLTEVFCALARSPELIGDVEDLRAPLLALARPRAWSYRAKRHVFRGRASRALGRGAPPELVARIDRAQPETAEELGLRAIEGLGPETLLPNRDTSGPEARTAPPGPPRGSWRPVPHSLRALVLLKARDAARPAGRYIRWTVLAAVLAGSLLLAMASERASPRVPATRYVPPPGHGGEVLERRVLQSLELDRILHGFREDVGER